MEVRTMPDRIALNDRITVGAQPSAAQLEQLAREGFKTIVNLRASGEADQPLSPDVEGQKVQEQGMQYLHIPVSPEAMQPEQVDQFRHELSRLPTPVFVHCKTGQRSGAFAMMHMAVERGMSGEETVDKAEQMGFECKAPALKKLVIDYVDAHRS
jgi:uncharacterized protein (TIGR01244 family)